MLRVLPELVHLVVRVRDMLEVPRVRIQEAVQTRDSRQRRQVIRGSLRVVPVVLFRFLRMAEESDLIFCTGWSSDTHTFK